MTCYHTLLESFNIINYGSSEKIQKKIVAKKWHKFESDSAPVQKDIMQRFQLLCLKTLELDANQDKSFGKESCKEWKKQTE